MLSQKNTNCVILLVVFVIGVINSAVIGNWFVFDDISDIRVEEESSWNKLATKKNIPLYDIDNTPVVVCLRLFVKKYNLGINLQQFKGQVRVLAWTLPIISVETVVLVRI